MFQIRQSRSTSCSSLVEGGAGKQVFNNQHASFMGIGSPYFANIVVDFALHNCWSV